VKIKDVIVGTKRRRHRDSRKNRIIQHDPLYTITGKELKEGKGRDINHLEDLAIFNGSAGAKRALNVLRQMETHPQEATIKWDGRPALIFGRNENGEFILTDKSGFAAKTYNGRVTSADDLEKMFLNRKLKDPSKAGERSQFAKSMANLWDTFEQATPEDFRGFVHGDLLYSKTPKVSKGKIQFTPNTTTYLVDPASNIGKKILNSDVGIVLHVYMDLENNKSTVDINKFKEGPLLVMPPAYVTQAPEVDIPEVDRLESEVSKYGSAIDKMMTPPAELQMKNFDDILYTFMNASTKSGGLENLNVNSFAQFIENSDLTATRKQKVLTYASENQETLNGLLKIIMDIMIAKNKIIDQLDKQPADIQAVTGGQPGGEGYVVGKDVKLVNRSGFTAANFARNN
jgi:hypothetical protein